MIKGTDVGELMIIYGLGFAACLFTIMLMYRFALSKAKDLDLNEVEIFDTKASMRMNMLMGMVPMLSVTMAIIFKNNPFLSGFVPGFTYFLYMPVMWINGVRTEKRRQKLLQQLSAGGEAPEGQFSSSNAGEPI
jgi:hypothetical protein